MMVNRWPAVKLVAFLFCLFGLAGAGVATPNPAAAPDQPSLASGGVAEAASRLKPGQFLWAPQIAPSGPVLVVVSLSTQRAVVYRNGVPIGISTVSTGRPGYETPTGAFVILQKHVEHYSRTYDNAPMPYMQRLTWGGIALHAGNLPGYPASHGCIRLPHGFAKLLYQLTQRGMTVIITERSGVPRIAPSEQLLGGDEGAPKLSTSMYWHPDKSTEGPLSIVISAADRRIIVLRNGVVIGSAAASIDGAINRTTAYILNGVVGGKRSWLRLGLPGQSDESEMLRGRITAAEPFRSLVDSQLVVGTTVIVTPDSLQGDSGNRSLTVIEAEKPVGKQ